MNSKLRIIAIIMIATVALSAAASQRTKKPSGNITRSGRAAATTKVAPATATPTAEPEASPEAKFIGPEVAPEAEETPTIAPVAKSELPVPEVKADSVPVLAIRPADSKIILPVGTAIRM